MSKDDSIRLRHMFDAAREARDFIRDRDRSALNNNRMLTLALMRSVEIIGEAASQVSKEFQGSHPEIPWSEMIGMRHRLIHGYFDVDLDRLWDTVTVDLPSLIGTLENLLIPQS